MLSRRGLFGTLASVIGSAGFTPRAIGQHPQRGGRTMRAYHEIMEEVLRENHIVGGSLAIAKDGRLVLARGYGLADAAARRPVTRDTLFCIGSVTKAITGVATLKLVDEGKVKLRARLIDVLDDIRPPGGRFGDPNFREITVRHLLQHTSGIPNRVKVKGNRRRKPGEDEDEEEEDSGDGNSSEGAIQLLRTAMAGPLDFAPGSEHSYSNSAFVVARLVIERASGKSYVPFVTEHILSMINTNSMGAKRATGDEGPNPAGVIRRRVNRELDGQKAWPEVDMFGS
jgi:CubicO group peptidase (beta-lactamase class C family)